MLSGLPGHVAANGEVQDDEEGMIEDPGCTGGEIGGGAIGDEVVVKEKFDDVGCPFDGVEMEAGGDTLACRKGEVCRYGVVAAIAGAVNGAVDG